MSSTDTVEHFLKQFPLITIDKGYNGFRQYWDGQLYHFFEFSSENQNPMYAENTFLHELCHFSVYTYEKFWTDFNHRYELLRESAAANRPEIKNIKELSLMI